MVVKLFQTRLIIQGFFIPKNQLKNDRIWLKYNEILLRQIDSELSAFIVTEGKDEYSERDAEKDAMKKISSYIRLCSLLTGRTPTIRLSGTRSISSAKGVGKIISVMASLRTGSSIGLSGTFLRSSKMLNDQIMRLNHSFLFLDTASSYYYSANALELPEGEKFSSRQFIDAAISLESLFNEGSGDITYKIAMRTALVLGLLGQKFNSIEVFGKMKELYNIRNDIAHGGAKRTKEYTPENANTILDYAKYSLICCYILSLNRKDQSRNKLKESLMKEIDNTLLDYSQRKLMSKEIAKGMRRFTIPNVIKRHY